MPAGKANNGEVAFARRVYALTSAASSSATNAHADTSVTSELELHPEVAEILCAAGWSPRRLLDPRDWIRVLEHEGYRFSPAAEAILARFGGLSVRPPPRPALSVQCDNFHFNPVEAAAGELDRFEEWEAFAKRELAPVGAVADWILCADDEGCLYIGSHNDLEVLGQLKEALEYLCLGQGTPRSLRFGMS